MFTLQPNLVVESRVHPSLHSNCHHQIVFTKLNLMMLSTTIFWHYSKANTDLIRRAIGNFDWEKAFFNSTVAKKDCIFFNKTILNVISNYISLETLICHFLTLGLNHFTG